tara:strand:+ start:5037 stop:5891 length:855 start_codon:yes stop_codon:yes gene_type:complete
MITFSGLGSDVAQGAPKLEKDYTVPYDSEDYIEPTYQNFEYILWRFGGYALDNEADILRFIALNDCRLYRRYSPYDIEWGKIQERYKGFLRDNLRSFPSKVRVKIPIALLRFDEEKSVFPLSDSTKFDGIRILPIKRFQGNEVTNCNINKSVLDGYSNYLLRDVVVSLKYPLTLKEVPIPREGAKDYIEYVQRFNNYNEKMGGRVSYAYYDIKIFDYIRQLETGGHLFYGEVDTIDIYADEKKKFPLYSYNPREGYADKEGEIDKRDSLVKTIDGDADDGDADK